MQVVTEQHPSHDSPPDWDRLSHDLLCPRCGYNLKLLVEPRCPECGLRSTWRELTERTIYEDRTGLFEYWWRRRPIRSLVSTLWRCMFPWLLWPRIPLVAEPRIGPLLALALIALLIPIGSSIVIDWAWNYWWFDVLTKQFPYGWREFGKTLWYGGRGGIADGLLMAAVGGIILAAMLVFRQSMARHRVRAVHLLRVAVLAWVGLVVWTCLVSPLPLLFMIRFSGLSMTLDWLVYNARDLPGFAMFVLSLGLGWSVYLRVRWGWTNAVLAVGLALVVCATILYHHTVYVAGGLNSELARRCADLWPCFTECAFWLMFGS